MECNLINHNKLNLSWNHCSCQSHSRAERRGGLPSSGDTETAPIAGSLIISPGGNRLWISQQSKLSCSACTKKKRRWKQHGWDSLAFNAINGSCFHTVKWKYTHYFMSLVKALHYLYLFISLILCQRFPYGLKNWEMNKVKDPTRHAVGGTTWWNAVARNLLQSLPGTIDQHQI